MRFVGGQWVDKGAVPTAAPLVVKLPAGGDTSVTAKPGASGAVTIEWTVADPADIDAGTALWFASTVTASATAANAVRVGPTTGVRITAATSAGSYELVQREIA